MASPTDPWGQAVPATTTPPGWTYREVFARDSYETFTGLLADGDTASAQAMVQFLYDRTQQADGSFPRNSMLDGEVAPDTSGLSEIDEDAYPLLMASSRACRGCPPGWAWPRNRRGKTHHAGLPVDHGGGHVRPARIRVGTGIRDRGERSTTRRAGFRLRYTNLYRIKSAE